MWWWEKKGVPATKMASIADIQGGPPGAYFISNDRLAFHLRCPCGRCQKTNILPLAPARGPYVWSLSGDEDKPTLSPSIHWFEKDGMTTHWHGWLREGYFEG